MESLSPIKNSFVEKFKDKKYFHRFFNGRSKDEIVSAIQELRELRNNISQSQLAELCKMKPSAVCRLEKAEYGRWNFQTLWRLAEALDARWRFVLEPRESVIDQYIHRDRSNDSTPLTGHARALNTVLTEDKQDSSRVDDQRKDTSSHIPRINSEYGSQKAGMLV